jgi:hypothetical protein
MGRLVVSVARFALATSRSPRDLTDNLYKPRQHLINRATSLRPLPESGRRGTEPFLQHDGAPARWCMLEAGEHSGRPLA